VATTLARVNQAIVATTNSATIDLHEVELFVVFKRGRCCARFATGGARDGLRR
jgi:hypothetical protein